MIFILIIFVSSDKQFPSIKFTKKGIFGWFNALALLKEPFNNTKIFGFRSNSSAPDLSMIVSDIVNSLNIPELNISDKIDKWVNQKNDTEPVLHLLDDEKCSDRIGNVYQFCKIFNVDLNSEKIGISQNHLDILIANIVGYIPTNLFFIILSSVAIIYYIIQLILSCFFCKPTETSPPSIFTVILFYSADCLVFISAILYFCSFTGINDFYSTITSLDTIIPRMTYSIATSLSSLFEEGIPNSLNPLFQIVIDLLNSTQQFFSSASDSFLNPTSIFLEKMSSSNQTNLGVFAIYNEKIQPKSKEFYEKASTFPNLTNISRFFFTQNFTIYQHRIQNLYDSVVKLSSQVGELVSLFEYANSFMQPWQESVYKMANSTIDDTNMTLGELFDDIKNKSIESFDYLSKLRRDAKAKNKLWVALVSVFFIVGVVFIVTPIVHGLTFMMHTNLSVCIASTASICPLVSTLVMFFATFFLTGLGFALVAISNQLERRVDGFIGDVIGRAFKGNEIYLPPINVTRNTDGVYIGVLNLSKVVFPSPIKAFEHLVTSDEDDGLASALDLKSVVDMNKYADEIATFVDQLGQNFKLGDAFIASMREVESALSLLKILPGEIDGFFNWGVPMSLSTCHLRQQIDEMQPSAISSLEPYLTEIDFYTNAMNFQYNESMHQLTHVLPESLSGLNGLVSGYIKGVMYNMAVSVRKLVRNVYPVIDSIKAGLIIGPYALMRNVLFYDIASACAFVSASGTLMICGLVVIVTLFWIRRRYMVPDSKGCFFSVRCGKQKVDNSENENTSQMEKELDSLYSNKNKNANNNNNNIDDDDDIDSSNDYAPSTDYEDSKYFVRSLNSYETGDDESAK